MYLAETPAGAMLEVLAHLPLDEADLPDSYRLLRVEAHGEVAVLDLSPSGATDWERNAQFTQQLGDAWLASGETALARVPSVILPYTWNYLLNPLHADAVKVEVGGASDHVYDPRLLRVRTGQR